ncbi:peroxiredoxin [Haloplanus halophilus]|uniref:peroxiredoxin n=1 Tax=Haloplanus halophilus TaxID=2949993 RepID=UPI00203CF832|nr:peroxiredoxin [Haloplanus sp. GDY1]
MLDPGDPVPDVSAPNQHGESVTPDFSEPTVVFFYPEDFTKGCTVEASEFQESLSAFGELGVTVYGVSMDDVERHAEFAAAEGLAFDLLADPEGEVAEAFGVSTDLGYADRRTVLIADGEVRATYAPDPGGHASEVLDDARSEFGGE